MPSRHKKSVLDIGVSTSFGTPGGSCSSRSHKQTESSTQTASEGLENAFYSFRGVAVPFTVVATLPSRSWN